MKITIGGLYNSVSNSNQEVVVNGRTIAQDATGQSQSSSITRVGNFGNAYYNGKITEFIVYDTDLTATEKQQVLSYLALKYGATLDQTTATAYLASDGTTKIWDETVDTAYTK